MLKFQWPFLITLLPLPLLINYFFYKKSKAISSPNGLKLPFYDDLIQQVKPNAFNIKTNWSIKNLLKLLLWLSFILAAMRPIWIDSPINLQIPTHDIILAIDISGSMQAEDMGSGTTTTRLDVVKQLGHKFLATRKSDRIGLIFFGSLAFVSSPLTLDQDSLHNFLEKTQIGFAGQKTAIGDAIGLAVKRLESGKDQPENTETRFIVLLSDGSNTSGEVDPIEAAKIAAEHKIKIYTIGIGQTSNNPLDILTGLSLDEKQLKEIARLTDGQYFHAGNKQALSNIYNEINNLEPTSDENKTLRPESEYFIYPLLVALGIIILLFF